MTRRGDYEHYLCGNLLPSAAREAFFVMVRLMQGHAASMTPCLTMDMSCNREQSILSSLLSARQPVEMQPQLRCASRFGVLLWTGPIR